MSSGLFVVGLLSLLLTPGSTSSTESQSDFEDLSSALVSHGFENVRVYGEPGTIVHVYYENRIYRYELRAMGVILAIVDERLSAPWTADLVPMIAGIPIVSVTTSAEDYKRFLSGEVDDRTYANALIIKTNPAAPPAGPISNVSYRRFDFSVGPNFSIELEQIKHAYRGTFNIVPQVETTLARGFLATGQLVIPVVDEIKQEASGVRPGRVTGDLLHRQGPLVTLFRAGIFDAERYGFSLGAGEWTWGNRVLLTAQGDLTGKLALIDQVWKYSSIDILTYSLAAQYWYPRLDVTLKASFGRFLGEEYGGRLDLNRFFDELEIAFFGIKTENESLIGILVNLPLPISRYPRPSAVRLKTVPALTWEYREKVTSSGMTVRGGLSIAKLYKGLAPTFIRNNVSEWIEARRMI